MPDRKHRRGQSLILFALSLPLAFAILGMVVDFGFAHYRRQSALAAAQAAALAAVSFASTSTGGAYGCGTAAPCPATSDCAAAIDGAPATSLQAGCVYAQANGYKVTPGKVSVSLTAGGDSSPPTVAGVNAAYWVTAVVSETVPLTFSAVLGKTSQQVSARATAAGFAKTPAGGCIYTLQREDTGLSLSGNGTVQTGCGVYVNAAGPEAVVTNGSANIVGGQVYISGQWDQKGNGSITPAPQLGIPEFSDPFESLDPPDVGACTSSGVSLQNREHKDLTPGVYCGKITLSGQSSVTLAPGVYVLKDSVDLIPSGIDMSGGSSMTGSGVTLYITSGGIDLSGGAAITLSAPTDASSPWQGVLMFQARNNSNTMNLTGGASQLLTGLVYAPNAQIVYAGNGGTTGTSTTLVAKSISLTGNGHIDNPATTKVFGGGGGIALVE